MHSSVNQTRLVKAENEIDIEDPNPKLEHPFLVSNYEHLVVLSKKAVSKIYVDFLFFFRQALKS